MNKPIILDNAIKRTGDDKKIFEYDYNLLNLRTNKSLICSTSSSY